MGSVTVFGECVLCGEPVHHGNKNIMPTSIGDCHAECFRDECGERWFLVVESLAKRIAELEKALVNVIQRVAVEPAAAPITAPGVEEG